jgi:rSAM/selenodomain-associated transferase 2
VISLIVPTYNEAGQILPMLARLGRVRGDCEVILADGASTDGTAALAAACAREFPHPLLVVATERHRARQLNSAARVARGDALVFLHADTHVPPDAAEAIEAALADPKIIGGNFDLIFEGDSFAERFFTWVYRVRRPLGIYYGDSGIFVRRRVFEKLGGFRDIPIMDDYEFVRRLERRGRTVCLATSLITSNRRWRVQGLLRTLASWVMIQTLYSVGVPPRFLARWYKPVREGGELPRQDSGGEVPGAGPSVFRAGD